MNRFAIALLALTLAACDGPAAGPAAASRSFAEADRAAILEALRLTANAEGRVVNECGDLTTPEFLPAELGGSVGTAILFAIGGGPSMAACYGDGPDLHLFMRAGAGWREIYSARGRYLIILSTSTSDVRDIADGGPGFSFPVWTWNGTTYAPANREISDAELSSMNATYLP
ncbi:MAG: hypothetical protein WD929_01190 [Steroidobacteraceae bacterium]